MSDENEKFDASGEITFYQKFWEDIKQITSAPEVAKRLADAVRKKKRLDWYDIRDYDLSEARDNERITNFPREGDCLLVLFITEGATASIRFKTEQDSAFSLADNRKFRHTFDVLYLSNSAQADSTLKLLFGRGDWEVERHHLEEEISSIDADMVDGFHARR